MAGWAGWLNKLAEKVETEDPNTTKSLDIYMTCAMCALMEYNNNTNNFRTRLNEQKVMKGTALNPKIVKVFQALTIVQLMCLNDVYKGSLSTFMNSLDKLKTGQTCEIQSTDKKKYECYKEQARKFLNLGEYKKIHKDQLSLKNIPGQIHIYTLSEWLYTMNVIYSGLEKLIKNINESTSEIDFKQWNKNNRWFEQYKLNQEDAIKEMRIASGSSNRRESIQSNSGSSTASNRRGSIQSNSGSSAASSRSASPTASASSSRSASPALSQRSSYSNAGIDTFLTDIEHMMNELHTQFESLLNMKNPDKPTLRSFHEKIQIFETKMQSRLNMSMIPIVKDIRTKFNKLKGEFELVVFFIDMIKKIRKTLIKDWKTKVDDINERIKSIKDKLDAINNSSSLDTLLELTTLTDTLHRLQIEIQSMSIEGVKEKITEEIHTFTQGKSISKPVSNFISTHDEALHHELLQFDQDIIIQIHTLLSEVNVKINEKVRPLVLNKKYKELPPLEEGGQVHPSLPPRERVIIMELIDMKKELIRERDNIMHKVEKDKNYTLITAETRKLRNIHTKLDALQVLFPSPSEKTDDFNKKKQALDEQIRSIKKYRQVYNSENNTSPIIIHNYYSNKDRKPTNVPRHQNIFHKTHEAENTSSTEHGHIEYIRNILEIEKAKLDNIEKNILHMPNDELRKILEEMKMSGGRRKNKSHKHRVHLTHRKHRKQCTRRKIRRRTLRSN
jgi:hypothetical protein